MWTGCNGNPIVFQGHGRREVTASFDGGRLSSDGGALLLREADNVFGVTGRLAKCFSDHRDLRHWPVVFGAESRSADLNASEPKVPQ